MGLNIVHKFTLLSVVATVIVVVGLSLLVSNVLTTGRLRDEGQITAETIRTVTAVDLTPEDFEKTVRIDSPVFAYIWEHLRQIPDVYKVFFYDTTGRVVWSDSRKWLGRSISDDEGLAQALEGWTVVDLGGADEVREFSAGLLEGEPLLEISVPLLSPEDGSVYGVVEVWKRPETFLASKRRLARTIWLAGTSGGLVLFLLLNGFFRQALRDQIRLGEVEKRFENVALELKVAGDIQRKLLPSALPDVRGYSLAAWHEPSRDVGGDYYDVFAAADGTVSLIVADSEGEGMPGALVSAEVRHHIRAEAAARRDAGAVAAGLDALLRQRGDGDRAVSCIYASLDPQSGTLRYCGAGSCVGLLDRQGEVAELESSGGPLGTGDQTRFAEHVADVRPGDCLVLCTDGVPEATNPAGERFAAERVRALLRDQPAGPDAQMMVDALRAELREFTGDGAPSDDLTVVCLVADPRPGGGGGEG
jgi:hypothetical protein